MRERISKRIIGGISYFIGLAMAICAGFEWYEIDSMLILAVLGNGTALLGIDAYKQLNSN